MGKPYGAATANIWRNSRRVMDMAQARKRDLIRKKGGRVDQAFSSQRLHFKLLGVDRRLRVGQVRYQVSDLLGREVAVRP